MATLELTVIGRYDNDEATYNTVILVDLPESQSSQIRQVIVEVEKERGLDWNYVCTLPGHVVPVDLAS